MGTQSKKKRKTSKIKGPNFANFSALPLADENGV